VADGVTGHLHGVGDVGALAGHLARLRADPDEARRLGAAGRARFLEHLGADRMVERFAARWTAEIGRHARPWHDRDLVVEVVHDPETAGALLEEAEPWLDGRGFFLSPAWVRTWWAWTGARPAVVAVRRMQGGLVGLLPLAERRAGVLGFAGQDEGADHLDVVAAPGHADAVAAAALAHLVRHPHGRLELRHVRADGALRRVLHDARHGIAWNERWATVCHEIDARGTWDGYLAQRFSRKRRHELRRTVKRFLERPGARVERARTPAEVASLLTRLFALHGQRFERRADGTVFEGRSLQAFHRRLAEALLPRGELLLMALVEGERDAAVYYAFRFHGRLLHFQSGIDDTEGATSAGTVLRACMVEDDVFGAGLQAFDFLDGDEAYKRPWATGRHDLFDLVVHPRGTRGRLAAAARGAFAVLKDEVRRRRRPVVSEPPPP
jgi:CelD/BcsL family acetyltransferase involved in cellulose biosynthesis